MLLRLRAIMVFIHCGFSLRPCLFRSANFLMWCICTLSLAPHTSHAFFKSLSTHSDRLCVYGTVTCSLTAASFLVSDNPPNIATSGFLPSRGMVSLRLLRGPCGVCVLACSRLGVFTSVVLFLCARVFTNDGSIVYRQCPSPFRL